MAAADWRLGAADRCCGSRGYVVFLRHFVPRMRDLAKASSEARSLVMGARRRQLHQHPHRQAVRARSRDEDAYVREAIDEHQDAMAAHMRLITQLHVLALA